MISTARKSLTLVYVEHSTPFLQPVGFQLRIVEEFAGAEGRLKLCNNEGFLQRFGLASLQELGRG